MSLSSCLLQKPDIGAASAHLVLDEQVGINTLGGMILVLGGTMLVTGFSPATWQTKRAARAR
ncbi:hypothetical protein [Pseudoalteromonas sp. DL2-H2.2]|uniref:hypothetical protein n=1 Tax=Pseudoalteromonas sp. DL2-H2.2 TaxID=2908889 RepID=UPI003FA7AAE8